MKVATLLSCCVLLVVLSAVVAEGKKSGPTLFDCGTFGPLQWYNYDPTFIITATAGSPLGISYGYPMLFGCIPRAVKFTGKTSGMFNFTYTNIDPRFSLVSGTTGLNFSAIYRILPPKNFTVLTSFKIILDNSPVDGTLTYQNKSQQILNETIIADSSFLNAQRVHPVLNYLGQRFEVGKSTAYTNIFSFANENLPFLVSAILSYINGVKSSETKYKYNMISEGHLIGSEEVNTYSSGKNTTTSVEFMYSSENHLLNELKITTDDSTTLDYVFKYDDSNRLTSFLTGEGDIYVSYDSQGRVATLNDTAAGYNYVFIN